MKVGYMTNAFGPLVGHGNGVVCPKDVRYVTMCDMEEAIKAIASKGYTSVEIFDAIWTITKTIPISYRTC